jgi:hypothetical protein
MSLNVSQLRRAMVNAAKDELGDKWPEIKVYAESEAKKIAETIKMIAKLTKDGDISISAARLHLNIQKNAARTVLLTVEGLGLLAVEAAVNAAVRAIRETVNTALGFALIP